MSETDKIKPTTKAADQLDGVVMRKWIDMLPAYDDEAWRDLMPEYREDALQDLNCLMCDIDFAKDRLTEQADRMERLEEAIKAALELRPKMATKVIEVCDILEKALDA